MKLQLLVLTLNIFVMCHTAIASETILHLEAQSSIPLEPSRLRHFVGGGLTGKDEFGIVTSDETDCQLWAIDSHCNIQAQGVIAAWSPSRVTQVKAIVNNSEVQVYWIDEGTHLWRIRDDLLKKSIKREHIYADPEMHLSDYWWHSLNGLDSLTILQDRFIDAQGKDTWGRQYSWLTRLQRKPDEIWRIAWRECLERENDYTDSVCCVESQAGCRILHSYSGREGPDQQGLQPEVLRLAAISNKGVLEWTEVYRAPDSMRIAYLPGISDRVFAFHASADAPEQFNQVVAIRTDGSVSKIAMLATPPFGAEALVAMPYADGSVLALSTGRTSYVWLLNRDDDSEGSPLVCDENTYVRDLYLFSIEHNRICLALLTEASLEVRIFKEEQQQ